MRPYESHRDLWARLSVDGQPAAEALAVATARERAERAERQVESLQADLKDERIRLHRTIGLHEAALDRGRKLQASVDDARKAASVAEMKYEWAYGQGCHDRAALVEERDEAVRLCGEFELRVEDLLRERSSLLQRANAELALCPWCVVWPDCSSVPFSFSPSR